MEEKVTAVSLDIGNNLTNLIDRLAQQIGVTANKVFPWYVEQVIIGSYTNLILIILVFLLGTGLIIANYKKADFSSDPSPSTLLTVLGLLTLIIIFACVLPLNGANIINGILNPEAQAMRQLLADLGKLR